MVLPHQRLAHIARGLCNSADTTHLSRVLSEAPWRAEALKRRSIRFMLQQTNAHRRRRRDALVGIDAPLGADVGSLCDDVARHDHQGDGT
jgi:hypothetical protein